MPGLNGIDAARAIARRAEIVFVTAHEHYAVQAFEHGAIDYVVKPFEEARLADSVARLKSRLAAPEPLPATSRRCSSASPAS
jgi:DNA-binding LytR/AlgR family response regulator